MKYRRILTITLVSVLLCTSISAMAMAAPAEGDQPVANTLRERFANMFYKFFSAIPSLNAFLLRRAPESGTPDAYGTPDEAPTPEPGTPETPEPPEEPIVLDLQAHLNCEEFRLGETITVYSTITNNGNTGVWLDEMSVKSGTLDYFIRTPEEYVIHLLDLPIFIQPESVYIKPGESYPLEQEIIPINIKCDEFTFIILSQVDSAIPPEVIKYEDFGEGGYTIWAEYTSTLEKPEPSSSLATDQVFNGQLKSVVIPFTIC